MHNNSEVKCLVFSSLENWKNESNFSGLLENFPSNVKLYELSTLLIMMISSQSICHYISIWKRYIVSLYYISVPKSSKISMFPSTIFYSHIVIFFLILAILDYFLNWQNNFIDKSILIRNSKYFFSLYQKLPVMRI